MNATLVEKKKRGLPVQMISFVYVNGDVNKNLLCHYLSVNFWIKMEDKSACIKDCSGFLYPLSILHFKSNFSYVLYSEFCTLSVNDFFPPLLSQMPFIR